MRDEMKVHVHTAIAGLMYSGGLIDQALLGEKRGYHQVKAHNGPFAQALSRVAEIADGADITDIAATRKDMLFLFDTLRYLRGGFYSSLWEILTPVHERAADLITPKEAEALAGKNYLSSLSLDARLGHLHPIEKQDGKWHTVDATFLGMPLGEFWYARYEVEAVKAERDFAEGKARS